MELIKAGTDDEGLPSHLVAYINDNGYSLPNLNSLNEVSLPPPLHAPSNLVLTTLYSQPCTQTPEAPRAPPQLCTVLTVLFGCRR